MPSTKTITSFYTFSPNTKARSSEQNINFGVFRGHILPVNTDTASASDLTHDLGDDTHRWNKGYFGTVNLDGATTTAQVELSADTTNTTGAAEMKIGSTTVGVWGITGFQGPYSNSFTSLKVTTVTASGNHIMPADVSWILVEGCGGGGGGGGGCGDTASGVRFGGGGGGSTIPIIAGNNITPGATITVTIGGGGSGGAGGTAGNPGSNGTNGATTTVTDGSWTMAFNPGPGGVGGAGGSGGSGGYNTAQPLANVGGAGGNASYGNGSASGNSPQATSAAGGTGYFNSGGGGGGACAASVGGNGGNAGDTAAAAATNGGNGTFGGGGGGGGAGTNAPNQTGGNGGNGGNGYVRIYYTSKF